MSKIIDPHGGYRSLKAYQTAEIIYDAANTMICLIHQANFLLDKLLRQLEEQFLQKGGFTEKLYHSRQAARRN